MWVRGGVHTGVWCWKPEGKRPLGIPRRRWESNIKMDFQEGGCGAVNWIDLAQGRESRRDLVDAAIILRVL